jgi:hypothetical protein
VCWPKTAISAGARSIRCMRRRSSASARARRTSPIFVAWEVVLEQTFLRYLCGYQSGQGRFVPTLGHYCTSLAKAEQLVFGRIGYALWHNPVHVSGRSQRHLIGCPHELVIRSNSFRLIQFAAVRHRIAHGQEDAKHKFDAATMNLAGRRYLGARPGRFLRDLNRASVPPTRWIEIIGMELVGLAQQIG